ncbi:MAG: diversity-generating retroelement protein Avd [Gammaproteobacteria bacterium]|nr:diversity-generating retroelement protein Avd [Gammaproteobacteria bacterium]
MTSPTPQAIQQCHELLVWLIPLLDQFPRTRRFSLGEKLENTLLEVLERLVEAAYARANQKTSALMTSNLRLEVARHLWRLCYELRIISIKRYKHGAELINDLGRQIGGWLRSSKQA